ncbi:hypothetical protein Leryth_005164 [Lithospermum erythrorhizon]|nr:hypothetical protein Leryth_005164 [Lithospermum erythrorhizon]
MSIAFPHKTMPSLSPLTSPQLFMAIIATGVSHQNAAGTDDGNKYEMKLVKKLAPHSHQALPFLTFETQGINSDSGYLILPLSRADLLSVRLSQLYRVSDMNQLQSFVDRMKHVGDALNVSISKYGDLHLQISTSLITLGAEFRKLVVLGEKADMPVGDGDSTAQTRMQRAVLRGDATSVQVSVKHFFKSLQCHLAKPDCAYFGIVNQGSCLTVIFEFFIPGTRLRDNAISLYCRLPVLDPGSS